jgi:type IV pilus assembly protein PilQ
MQSRRASLALEVERQVTPAGRAVPDLDMASDCVAGQTTAGPASGRNRAYPARGGSLRSGVDGRVYASDDRDDVTQMPLLGKIPVPGAHFGHRAHRRQRSELVIFITPRVVAAGLTHG